jgi:hypothetical protein
VESEFRSTVLREFSELEQSREIWQAMPWSRIDADFDFFVTFAQNNPQVVAPFVVVVREYGSGTTVGMMACRLEDLALTVTLGYKVILRKVLRSIVLVHGGVVGAEDGRIAEALLGAVREALRLGQADVAWLPKLPLESPLRAAAGGGLLTRSHLDATSPHWSAEIPNTFADFLQARSTKTRKNVKYYRNVVLKNFGDELEVRVFDRETHVDKLIRDVEEVARKTYQRALGVGFADDQLHRMLISNGLRRRSFRAWVLYLSQRPIAFWSGYAQGGTFYVDSPGYDPELTEYRVGNYLQMKMIEDLCRDPTVSRLDYGFGDAQYKATFGDHYAIESDVFLFAPRLRPIALNLSRTGTAGAMRIARAALGGRATAAIKRRWRRRLTSPSS